MTQAKSEGSAGRRKAAIIGMLVAGLIVPALGIALAWKSCGHGAVAGAIEVKDSTIGSWRMIVATCKSGGETFRGVELRGRDGKALTRVEIDPIDGPIVTVWASDGKGALTVRKKDCSTLAVDVRDAGKRDEEAPARYDGSAGGACSLPGGGTLTIDAWWRDCGE